jgi:hypothetical protein
MALTCDASKRLINFYLDEADAMRLDKICGDLGISRTQFISERVASELANIELTPADIEEINANIQRRIDKGYPKNYRSETRYKRG